MDGVEVLHRGDSNTEELIDGIAECIIRYSEMSHEERSKCAHNAFKLSEKAQWKHFYKYYREAYTIAEKVKKTRR